MSYKTKTKCIINSEPNLGTTVKIRLFSVLSNSQIFTPSCRDLLDVNETFYRRQNYFYSYLFVFEVKYYNNNNYYYCCCCCLRIRKYNVIKIVPYGGHYDTILDVSVLAEPPGAFHV